MTEVVSIGMLPPPSRPSCPLVCFRLSPSVFYPFSYPLYRFCARRLLNSPHEWLPIFEGALLKYVREKYLATPERLCKEYFIGYEGAFGSHKVTPRQLTTILIGKLVCVEGIVTKLSLVRPKLVESVHYCPKTNVTHTKHHRDATSLAGPATAPVFPTHDAQNNPLEVEYGLSTFKDYQTIQLQEMPEKAPPGQLPRSVEVLVENDLVDRVKPGDRIRVIGAYRALPNAHMAARRSNSVFSTILIANNIQLINKDIQGPHLTSQDIKNIRALSKDPKIFTLLASSLAPSIYGHDYIKKSVLLQLLGGVEKDLKEAGIRLRGDINILLVGDPGTAKSQMLRFVLHVAPLCISTTGRGASGVGLTAAVVHDSETGDRRLEAGAMVLADRGIVCIDEFDKMSPEDRVSIHEVMEQQTVTIAKAGIHASLNARCSVLGAANPLFGKYDRNRTATDNIALPDSLLSRFDLLFIVLDNMDPTNDRNVAEHVLRMHRYHSRDAGMSMESTIEDWELNPDGDTRDPTSPVYLPYDKLIHVNKEKKILSIPFVKKYLMYAKEKITPVLDFEAEKKIVEAFDDLRRREDSRTLPVTARTLETMIRLTVAHAKCRLSFEATIEDANVVLEIMRFALYNEDTGSNVRFDLNDQFATSNAAQRKKRAADEMLSAPSSTTDATHGQDGGTATNTTTTTSGEMPTAKRQRTLTDEEVRYREFEKAVIDEFKLAERVKIQEVLTNANKSRTGDDIFSAQEAKLILLKMEDAGKLVVLEDDAEILMV